MTKFEVELIDDLWRICDLLRQMEYKHKSLGFAVIVDDMKEQDKLSILYMVRCTCVQPTEYDEAFYNAL